MCAQQGVEPVHTLISPWVFVTSVRYGGFDAVISSSLVYAVIVLLRDILLLLVPVHVPDARAPFPGGIHIIGYSKHITCYL